MEKQEFKLSWGIHRGTLISRDCPYEPEKFTTEEKAIKRWQELYAWYTGEMGMQIWFATLHYPDGTKKKLCEGAPYH
jgi:hypothetical protein